MLKLKYDPKRAIKLRKNDILNELRTKFSQKIYEAFKTAENKIWTGNDHDFQFVDEIVKQLQSELGTLQLDLKERAKAWADAEKAETGRKITVNPSFNSTQVIQNTNTEKDLFPQNSSTVIPKNEKKSENPKQTQSFLPEPDFDIPPQKVSTPKTPLKPFDEDEFDFFEEL